MPIYAFRCPDCSTEYEERRSYQSIDDKAVCPTCNGERVQRLLSIPVFIRGRSSIPVGVGGGCACSAGGACACKN
jgi:putative FmdB family regulatory protein